MYGCANFASEVAGSWRNRCRSRRASRRRCDPPGRFRRSAALPGRHTGPSSGRAASLTPRSPAPNPSPPTQVRRGADRWPGAHHSDSGRRPAPDRYSSAAGPESRRPRTSPAISSLPPRGTAATPPAPTARLAPLVGAGMMDKDTKARHENGLTEREAQVVKLSARGFTNREWLSRIEGLASAWIMHTIR
jgi:hypothetical protein